MARETTLRNERWSETMFEPMPTQQDYERVSAALSGAFDQLDTICFSFAKNLGDDFDELKNQELDPSLADVAKLYSFITDLQYQTEDFSRFESKLARYLEILNGLRLDLEAARRHLDAQAA
jgi:hypothetical protein